MIIEFAELVAARTGWQKGSDLFVEQTPNEREDTVVPDYSVLVRFKSGTPDALLLDRGEAIISILVRSRDWNQADTEARRIYGIFHGKTGLSTNSFHLSTIRAMSLPTEIGPDVKRRHVRAVDYVVRYKEI